MFVIGTITIERKWINTFHTNVILRLIVKVNYSGGDWGHYKISGKMYSVVLGMKIREVSTIHFMYITFSLT